MRRGRTEVHLITITGAYFKYDERFSAKDVSPASISIELSRPFRSFHLWFPLQLHGVDCFKAALYEKRLLALYFYEKVQEIPGVQVGPYPDLCVCLFRFVPTEMADINPFNDLIVNASRDDGRFCLASTVVNGQVWIRLAITCFRTHKEEVDALLRFLPQHASSIKRRMMLTRNLTAAPRKTSLGQTRDFLMKQLSRDFIEEEY